MIGEIRDRETMQQALLHTLTGHLCLPTLHANNSYHALSRIINLFPYDARSRPACPTCRSACARSSRSASCATSDGELQPAVEILLNTSLIAELIKNGEFVADQGSDGASRSTPARRPSSRRCAASTSTA